MQDVIVNSNEGFYGELIIPSSVKEFIPPLLTTGLYAVFSQDDVIWWNDYRKRNYDLKILMDKRYVEKSLNIRKQNFINYFLELDKKYEDKIYENRIKFVKYFSLFPMSPFIMDSYYNNIYIDDSFKSIDGLNLLFGGARSFSSGVDILSNKYNIWFEKMLSDNKIYYYSQQNNGINSNIVISNIIWIK